MRYLAFVMGLAAALTGAGLGLAQPKDELPSLRSIKKLYVEKMPNDLDQYIRAEITKQFKGRILVVTSPEDADAIMAGVANGSDARR